MSDTFQALGKSNSKFKELEVFPNPGCSWVEMTSDEVTAVCPVTGQPDYYTVKIVYYPKDKCVESKSLKLYLGTFRNKGVFCEALAVEIADHIKKVVDVLSVDVTVTQKSRGGIVIESVCTR
jgi:7-cyano-7-deazaguanine reductase